MSLRSRVCGLAPSVQQKSAAYVAEQKRGKWDPRLFEWKIRVVVRFSRRARAPAAVVVVWCASELQQYITERAGAMKGKQIT